MVADTEYICRTESGSTPAETATLTNDLKFLPFPALTSAYAFFTHEGGITGGASSRDDANTVTLGVC